MAIQDFTAGQVLTAAQMDSLQANDYNWTVSNKTASYTLAATDKGTRVVMSNASATTITVNTNIFAAGDTLFIQNIGAGTCTITAGTATVTSAGSLAIPQWGSGTLYFTSASAAIYFPSAVTTTSPALVYITSASVSAALTLTVSNVFSATYENYLMTFTNLTTSSGGNVGLQMATGGTANASAVYQIGSWRVAYNAGTGNGSGYASNQTSFLAVITDTSGTPSHGSFNFYAPFATQQTGITTLNAGGNQSQVMAGIFAGTTSFDGIKLTATQNMTGTFKFYGIANS